METIKNFINAVVQKIMEIFDISEKTATYALYVALGLVLVIIILIICLCVKGSKKKKLAKKANAALKAEEKVNEENVYEVSNTLEQENVNCEMAPIEEETVEEIKVEEDIHNDEIAEEAKTEEVASCEEPVETKVEEEVPIEGVNEENKAIEENSLEKVDDENADALAEKKTRVIKGKFEVFPVGPVFIYRLKASNGEILVTSEIYTTQKGAINAIETVKKNVETGSIQITKDKHDLWQFIVYAANKRQLVASANYDTEDRCQKAMESFKRFAPISSVVELEEDPEHLMEEFQIEVQDKQGGKIDILNENEIFYYQLKASNGQVMLSSSEYKTRKACTDAIEVLKEAVNDGRFFVVKDKKGAYQYKLYAKSGRCVATGETYSAKSQAISSANSMVSFLKNI